MACVRARGVCVCVRLSAPCVRTRPPAPDADWSWWARKSDIITRLCGFPPPERSNPTGRSETLLHAAVERKPKICALLSLCHDNSVTAEYNWHGGGPGALFMHFSCFNLELPQRDSFLFFFVSRPYLEIWKHLRDEKQKGTAKPVETLRKPRYDNRGRSQREIKKEPVVHEAAAVSGLCCRMMIVEDRNKNFWHKPNDVSIWIKLLHRSSCSDGGDTNSNIVLCFKKW